MAAPLHISVVSPVYGCANCLNDLYTRLTAVLTEITPDYEIIFINDASRDNAWESTILNIAKVDKKVKGINFSRNFGQHYAISAGLTYAKGEWIVVMDCDLQDLPEEILNLYKKAQEGFEIVLARRINRQDNFIKRFASYLFYKLFSYLTDTVQDHSVANFGIYHKKIIAAINKMQDHIRYFPAMVQWVGFKKTHINVEHSDRHSGKTSYSFKRLLLLALDNIIAFSDKPLRLTVKFGALISLFSMLIGVYFIVKYLSGEIIVLGYSSLIVSLWFLSGVIIMILGMVGIYIGKTFEKVKNRPIFIIDSMVNITSDE